MIHVHTYTIPGAPYLPTELIDIYIRIYVAPYLGN